MPQVSLTDYRATQEAAERQKRLAAALREQSTSPIQVQSYDGIQAPIPFAEVLARALSGYAANRKEAKADEAIAEGRAKASREAIDYLKALKQETPQERFIAPPNFQPEQTGFIDRLKQAGQSFMPQQAAPPQQMSAPQAPPPMAPAQPMPMPQGPEALPQMSDMRQVPAELQNRARSPEEQQQMLMDAMMSGNPYLESIAPKMYADMEASMQAQEDRDRKVQAIMGLDATDEQKQQMMAAEMGLSDNPAFRNAIKPPVPIQSPEGVIGLVAQKVANGEPLSEGEKQIWQMYTARQRKMSYIAPRGGDGSGRDGPAPVRVPTLKEIDAAILAAGG
jgi:hypothetical protein